MKRLIALWIVVMLLETPGQLWAGVFARDWKTPGDGLLTYDDVNQREWLDLSASRLDQFSEPRLPSAIAQIAPGGLFEGFSFAKHDDVNEFAQSAGINTATQDFITNQVATVQLVELLGRTVVFTSGTIQSIHSIGFINETELIPPNLSRQFGVDIFLHFSSIPGEGGRAGVVISASNDLFQLPATGLMLFRTIPEPSCVALLILGFFGLAGDVPCRRGRSVG